MTLIAASSCEHPDGRAGNGRPQLEGRGGGVGAPGTESVSVPRDPIPNRAAILWALKYGPSLVT